MSDSSKKIANPLFSASVTGGTVEDFSQHAFLLPAREPTPPAPPVLDVTQEPSATNLGTFLQPIPADQIVSLDPIQTEHNTNLPSSVFSSFSSLWKNTKTESEHVQSTSEPFLSVGPPVSTPFQSPVLQDLPLVPPPTTRGISGPKSGNPYLSGKKRLVYPRTPGLSTKGPAPTASPFDLNLPSAPEHISSPVMADIPADKAVLSNVNLDEIPASTASALGRGTNQKVYRPVYYHWFHKRIEWEPFSMVDSLALETAFTSNDLDPDRMVPTDGGRYDVNILRRERVPVYWKRDANEVRRCSWFHKNSSDGTTVPYEENIATKLEEEYKLAFESNQWNRKVEFENGDIVIFHGPDVLVLYPPGPTSDAWGNTGTQPRPKVVKRGLDEFNIEEGEPVEVDHLLFLVHGIGSVCDIKFRSVEEVVDEFRSISLQLVQAHYRSSVEKGVAHRVEVLPISWHEALHSDETGIDEKLKSITLESIPKLRFFTNDTLLDILFYTSPVYCQTIVSAVGNELNRIYDLFKKRNPHFTGGVSLGGHSLGSLIVFDILCHQKPEKYETVENEGDDMFPPATTSKPPPLQRKMSRRISYMMGNVGTGQPQIHYPHLNFQPRALFALGSPIGMFVTVRGLDNLGQQFALPTCPAFFNIFHPYDPVAYRIESLINTKLGKLKPVLIPHHKGRKRIHLELQETMARVGADLKQRVVDSMKSTWNSVYQLAMFARQAQPPSLEEEVNKAFEEKLGNEPTEQEEEPQPNESDEDISPGLLNNSRRIDYVLQETPFEFFNEYLFAITSHLCYWESQDTMLLILKEIYSSMNISPDDKVPQQTMTIERPPASPKSQKTDVKLGMDPTVPIKQNTIIGPPPTSGFVKKT